MLWHLVQIDRQRDKTECLSGFSSMALRGLLSPSFNFSVIPTGLFVLSWELPKSCRMEDLPALLQSVRGTWRCFYSKSRFNRQGWRWWLTMVMIVMCSIYLEWVSYLFFSLFLPLFLSTSLLFISPTPRLALNPPTPDLLSLGDLWKREREREWVNEWLPNRMFPCNYHFEATVPSVLFCLWVTLTKQLPKLFFKPLVFWYYSFTSTDVTPKPSCCFFPIHND